MSEMGQERTKVAIDDHWPLTPKHVTLNGHFALNSVLCWYIWSSEAWLSKLGYS